MKIALVQQSASPDRGANLERALGAIRRAAAQGVRLVLFAELAVDRFFPQCRGKPEDIDCAEPVPGPTTERLAEAAREHGVVVVFNLLERTADGRFFDSSPVVDADGRLLGATRMIHIPQMDGFWEQDYYTPGSADSLVYETAAGRIGIAICYDRHYPEVMRALALGGAELVAIPQAGAVGEWPEGLYEAEIRTAAFQNGYWAALVNRVGREDALTFAGESFVVDPEGQVSARARALEDDLLITDVALERARTSTARRHFLPDRRPELYARWFSGS